MRIALFGGECYYCQLPRIKEGILQLNHTIDQINPEIIYSNDPEHFDQAIKLKKDTGAFLILNILDIPWHIQEFNQIVEKWKNKLQFADAVTTISHTVKNDLETLINRKVNVIFNPVKDVNYNKDLTKKNIFLYVGRANDINKRINLVFETLNYIQNGLNLIKICGTENPGFGNYLGLVSDIDLNILYNTSKFLFLPSKNEGIGLPMIEAMICGAIPISCSDNRTTLEFSPKEFICEPNAQSILNKIIELNNNYEKFQKLSLEYGQKYKNQFNKLNIAKNIINVYEQYKK